MESETPKRSEDDEDAFQRAIQLRAAGDLEGAEVLLRDLAHRCPDDLLVQLILGGVLFNLSSYAKAAMAFRRVLDARPANEPSSLGLFICLWRLGNRQAALNEMDRFLAISESKEYERLKGEFERAIHIAEEEDWVKGDDQ